MKRTPWIVALAAFAPLLACGDGGGSYDAGAGGADIHHTYFDGSTSEDAGVDAAAPDAGPADAGDAAGPDGGLDAGGDAEEDADVDAGIDATVDGGADTGIDAGADAGADGGTIGAAPTITSITPDHGGTAGGTTVVVTGMHFRTGLSVTFDRSAATAIVITGGVQLTCRTPPHAKGAVDLKVENADGTTATSAGGFTFEDVPPPVITGVSPGSGSTTGGTAVAVAGTGFAQGATVLFGTSPAAVAAVVAGKITCTAPAHGKGEVDVTVTNPDGQSSAAAGAFTYTEPGPRVDWCDTQYPASITTKVNAPTENIYGRVFEAGVTEAPGKGAGIAAQLGYGDPGDDPSADPSLYTWVPAVFNVNAGNNDEYMASLTVAAEGVYAYVYRFSMDGGATWVFCDLDGSDNGFSRLAMGTLTVEKAGLPAPTVATVSPGKGPVAGGTPVTVTGQGFTAGAAVTFGGADATQINVAGLAMITCTAPAHAAGAVDVTVRNTDGQSGTLAAGFTFEAPAQLPTWGKLQWPPRMTIAPSEAPGAVYGRVFEPGITDTGGNAGLIKAQVGWGPRASDPAAGGWQWTNAGRNAACTDCGLNYEYSAAFAAPPAGHYDYAARFSLDGASWLYADLDGTSNGYAAGQAGKLAAGDVPEWCTLQWPPDGVASAGAWFDVFGRVYKAGITGAGGTHYDLEMGAGYAATASDPAGTDWTWWSGHLNMGCGDCGNNDEFTTPIKIDAAGTYRYVVRFRYMSGPWIFCDADGSDNGLQPGSMGTITVQ